jgi:hypothetical protein
MLQSRPQRCPLVSLLIAVASVISLRCIRPLPDDPSEILSSEQDQVSLVWDGDLHGGNAKEWSSCNFKEACKSTVKVMPAAGLDDSNGLEWHVEGKDWKGFGWNWHGFWPPNAGTDATEHQNLSFWVRLKLDDPKKAPAVKDITVSLCSSNKGKEESAEALLGNYADGLADGKWHEVIIPLRDFTKGKGKNFDLTKAWEFRMGEFGLNDRNYTVYVDNIGFDSRTIISLISLPQKRDPATLGSEIIDVTAKVDLRASGTFVSPYIYGVSHGDVEALNEMGVTIRRQGGNTSSAYDWRTGFTSTGADWYFENTKQIPGVHPQETWWAAMHRENRKYGMKSFFTMPSEWVAKDNTSVGFPKDLYPDCEEYAPDRPQACNGKLKTKDKDGKPISLRCKGQSHNGKKVDLEYNVELVKYCIKDAGFGRADQGGVDIIALDNEPMLYRSTHCDMFCKGFGYDEYWERTTRYAELIRQADPTVKIAAPSVWGWTAYNHGSADVEYQEDNGIPWEEAEQKLPDYSKYGPFTLDFMRRCAAYKKETGHNLIDIFSFHGYPMTPKLDWANREAFLHPTPELQEFRVRDVRKFWDESYRDPDTWMGKEKWANGNIAYVPLMRRRMKEAGWTVPIAIGEYDHAGPEGGSEISAAVAQAETLAAFARSEVTYAFYWADPRKHGPVYFAFKMYRNPDGKRTAVGDRLLVPEVSDFDSVSVYAYKDTQHNVTSFMLHNKRASKGVRLALDLGTPISAQKATRYEYSNANPKAIGALPPLDVSGQIIHLSVAPMSILRVDVKM